MAAEGCYDRGVELAAGVALELCDRVILATAPLVATLVDHRLVCIAGSDDSGP